jgi:hypothetical protein
MLSAVTRFSVTAAFLVIITFLLVIPVVFSIVPISAEAEAVTLCLPGIGPVQRFTEDLSGQQEERVYLHEGVHAEQCRELGATWFARKVTNPQGRLAMEVQALCAEANMRALRGADRQREVDLAIEILATEYFSEGDVGLQEITVAVERSCGVTMSE